MRVGITFRSARRYGDLRRHIQRSNGGLSEFVILLMSDRLLDSRLPVGNAMVSRSRTSKLAETSFRRPFDTKCAIFLEVDILPAWVVHSMQEFLEVVWSKDASMLLTHPVSIKNEIRA